MEMTSLDKGNPAALHRRWTFAAFGRLRGYAFFWLKALSQPTIDLTLRTGTRQLTRIVESPGVSLPPDELDALVARLRTVATKTQPHDNQTKKNNTNKPERLKHAIITLISDEDSG